MKSDQAQHRAGFVVVLSLLAACSANDVGEGRTIRGTDRPDTGFTPIDATTMTDGGPTDAGPTVNDAGFGPDSGVLQLFRSATVGRRCGTGTTNNYVVLSPMPATNCVSNAQQLDAWNGSPVAYAILPQTSGQVDVMATVCLDASGCQMLPVTFFIEQWSQSVGASVRWAFDLPDGGGRVVGDFNAGWCEYDEFLPGGASGIASNIAVTDVHVLQGTTVPIVTDGALVEDRFAPVVEGRPGLLRVFVRPQADFTARDIVARLTLDVAGLDPVDIELRRRVAGPSEEDVLDSTFNFELSPQVLNNSLEWKVGLYETAVCSAPLGDTDNAEFPRDGQPVFMSTRSSGDAFNVVLVPIDIGGALPDTSLVQIERYRTRLLELYPVPEINLTVRETLESETLSAPPANRAQWDLILDELLATRAADSPPNNTYYYGLVPTNGGPGTIGLSPVPGPAAVASRGSVGTGRGGNQAAETMAHELGHTTGQLHAPCGGAPGTDAFYAENAEKYGNGGIGVNGYNIVAKELILASGPYREVMSYCDPTWFSDFSFSEIFERLAFVNRTSTFVPWPEREIRVAIAAPDAVLWGKPRVIRQPVLNPELIQFEDAGGNVVAVVEADRVELNHDSGDFYYVPLPFPAGAMQVRLPDGRALALTDAR